MKENRQAEPAGVCCPKSGQQQLSLVYDPYVRDTCSQLDKAWKRPV